MQLIKKTIILFILLGVLSCKTDFDINATYKDITVVYCLLNQNDSIHYARIHKAFLGEGNAYEMAQDPALSLYPYEDLDVSMEEWVNGSLIQVFTLDTVIIPNKESGNFYYPTQTLYAFTALLNQNATYKLKIRNKALGKLIEAETKIVQNFQFEKPYMPPVPPPPQIYIHPFVSFVGTSPVLIEWLSGKNGKRYQLSMTYYYQEMSLQDTVIKSVEWNLGNIKTKELDGTEKLTLDINKESFFIMLKSKIPVNTNVRRKSLYFDFVFSVAGDEFNTYMEVNEPSTNLIQEKPHYTNISNGLGIFCSRFVKDKLPDGRPLRFQLNPQSISLLINGEHTKYLGFIE